MIKVFDEEKPMTPNQLAKWIIEDQLTLCDYWYEKELIETGNMTEKEIQETNRHLNKHISSILKRLGIV